jgi:hypothetical protein
MRYGRFLVAVLFAGSLVSSCTCRQQVEQVTQAPSLVDRPPGFVSSKPTVIGATIAAPPTPQPTEPQTLTAPTPADTEEIGLPPDFPSDIPPIRDGEVAAVNELPQNARGVIVRTAEPREYLYDLFERDLRDKGWVVEQNYNSKDQSFLGFRKGTTILNVIMTNDPKDPGKRIVSFMYQEEEPIEFDEF